MYCSACGQPLDGTQRFCPGCGRHLLSSGKKGRIWPAALALCLLFILGFAVYFLFP